MVLHLPIGLLETCCWSRYQDANPVPTSLLADDLAIAQSGMVLTFQIEPKK